ncbi:hypothetical protein [Chitinibacter sp. S2-10]|uniref:hypothetical protein n=1 Tax=Chitinibacter sp. S2-10 TaxID=3373597 RepID=UPI00397762F3
MAIKKFNFLLLAMLSVPAWAQEPSMFKLVKDPSVGMPSLQLGYWTALDYHQRDWHSNTFMLRSIIPFQWGEQNHIMRISVPIAISHPVLGDGLADTSIFELMVFDQDWGRFGLGFYGLLPTGGSERGAEQWAFGPALGIEFRSPGLLWGLFNQNAFTVAGDDQRQPVKISLLQPFVTWQLGDGWSAHLSEMQFSYDWENRRWRNLPLGLGISKTQKLDRVPVQFNLQYEHNFADKVVAPANTIRFNVRFFLPD